MKVKKVILQHTVRTTQNLFPFNIGFRFHHERVWIPLCCLCDRFLYLHGGFILLRFDHRFVFSPTGDAPPLEVMGGTLPPKTTDIARCARQRTLQRRDVLPATISTAAHSANRATAAAMVGEISGVLETNSPYLTASGYSPLVEMILSCSICSNILHNRQ